MSKRNTSSGKESGKLTFFENIYYWLWFYLDKVIPKNGMEPPIAAVTFLQVFRMFNIFFILAVISVIIKVNIFKNIILDDSRIGALLMVFPIVLIAEYFFERRYMRNVYIIIDKVESLTKEERSKRRIIFFAYILLTIGTSCMLPWLSSFFLK